MFKFKERLQNVDPLLTILLAPRLAFRQIVVKYRWPAAVFLFLIYGLAEGMDQLLDEKALEMMGRVGLTVFAFVGAPIIGCLVMIFWSWLSKVFGRMMGGTGDMHRMFAAGWALCPSLYVIPISYFQILVLGIGSEKQAEIVQYLERANNGLATEVEMAAMSDPEFPDRHAFEAVRSAGKCLRDWCLRRHARRSPSILRLPRVHHRVDELPGLGMRAVRRAGDCRRHDDGADVGVGDWVSICYAFIGWMI